MGSHLISQKEVIIKIPLSEPQAPSSTARATRAGISPATTMASVMLFPTLGLFVFSVATISAEENSSSAVDSKEEIGQIS